MLWMQFSLSTGEGEVWAEDYVDGMWFRGLEFDFENLGRLKLVKRVKIRGRDDTVHVRMQSSHVEASPKFYFCYLVDLRGNSMFKASIDRYNTTKNLRDLFNDEMRISGVFKADVFVKLQRKDLTSVAEWQRWSSEVRLMTGIMGCPSSAGAMIAARLMTAHTADWFQVQRCIMDSCVVQVDLNKTYAREMIDCRIKMYGMEIDNGDHLCALCGWISGQKMKQCACRKKVRYCSKRCQLVHWRLGHKDECSEAAKL